MIAPLRRIREKVMVEEGHIRMSAAKDQVTQTSRPGYLALAAAMTAGALMASAPAYGADGTTVSERIAASFAFAQPKTSALEAMLARRAARQRSLQNGVTVAALPYVGLATSLADIPFPGTDQTRMLDVPIPQAAIAEARLPRPRPDYEPIVTGSIEAPASAPVSGSSEAEYLRRFAGSFSGDGQVQQNAGSGPHNVKCNLTGRSTASDVSISGKCSVFVISREIRADIHYDPASGRYTGTYIGSKVGPARLSGTRQGDAVVLAITWPKPVNGDTKATMTIRNSGNGKLAIIVNDRLEPGGPTAPVTQIALNR